MHDAYSGIDPLSHRISQIEQSISEQLKAKDQEIEALKAENKRWCNDYYKLKFELETSEAENKRMRDGIEWLFKNEAWDSENHCYLVHPSYLKELLSPADEPTEPPT